MSWLPANFAPADELRDPRELIESLRAEIANLKLERDELINQRDRINDLFQDECAENTKLKKENDIARAEIAKFKKGGYSNA